MADLKLEWREHGRGVMLATPAIGVSVYCSAEGWSIVGSQERVAAQGTAYSMEGAQVGAELALCVLAKGLAEQLS